MNVYWKGRAYPVEVTTETIDGFSVKVEKVAIGDRVFVLDCALKTVGYTLQNEVNQGMADTCISQVNPKLQG